MRRLPSLNAVRAFEAAARHLSMSRAAAELHVTPGAVSQLVRALERELGTALFHRLNRALALTPAGRAYSAEIGPALERIAAATAALGRPAAAPLTVSASPAFAAAWLAPRLGRFQDRHPGVGLRLVTGKSLADFARDGIDLAIRYGAGRYPGLAAERLMRVALVPVCSPELIVRTGAPREPAELAALPLLHDGARRDWTGWFHAMGTAPPAPLPGPSFDDMLLLLGAALAGQGVALVQDAVAHAELAAGRLMLALDAPWPRPSAYWCVYPEAFAERPALAAFRDWLLAEAHG